MVKKLNSIFKKVDLDELLYTVDFKKLISGVRRWILLILAVSFFSSLFGVYLAFQNYSTYTAVCRIFYVSGPRSNVPGVLEGGNLGLSTLVNMMKFPSNMEALKSVLGLQDTVKELSQNISVSFNGRSPVVTITAKSTDPNKAIDITNTVANLSIKNSARLMQKQLQQALSSFQESLDLANKKYAKFTNMALEYQIDKGIVGKNVVGGGFFSEFSRIQNTLENIIVSYNRALSQYEVTKERLLEEEKYVQI